MIEEETGEENAEEVARQIRERQEAIVEQRAAAERRRAEDQALAAAAPQWARPTKVVKRLIKETDVDGTESYRVEFLFDPAQVERVKRARAAKVEEMRKEMRLAARRSEDVGNRLLMKVGPEVLELEEKKRKGEKINLSHLKKKQKSYKQKQEIEKREKSEAEKRKYQR